MDAGTTDDDGNNGWIKMKMRRERVIRVVVTGRERSLSGRGAEAPAVLDFVLLLGKG